MQRRACAEHAHAIVQKCMAFIDIIIREKSAAMDEERDVDFQQFHSTLEELLDVYPCVKHTFWEPVLDYCALQIRADALSGKHQKAKRITSFCEFGCASANKAGRDSFSRSHPPKRVPRASAGRGMLQRTLRVRGWGIPTNG